MAIVDVAASASLVLHPKAIKEMISVTRLPKGRRKVRINSSSIATIQECLRKSKYSLLQGWKSENESPATLFGSAIHAAHEHFYKSTPEQRKLPKLELMERMSYGHKVEGMATDPLLLATAAFITKAQPLAILPESDKRSVQNGVWLLHEYFKKFIDDPYTAYVDEQGPFLERSFNLPFYSDSKLEVELFGQIDFVFKNTTNGILLPGDHKTSSSLSFGDSSYYDRDRPNTQYTIYSMAANKIFGIKSEDFMVNIFEVKAKPKTARGSEPTFPRQLTKRTEEDYEELEEIVVDAVERYLYAIDFERWPLGSVDICNKYGGCPYKQVCASPKSMREIILRNKFKDTKNAI